jgi:hypothetical protein
MRRAIGVRRQADHQVLRLPFGNQLADGGKAVVVRFGVDGGQRMSAAEQGFAGGDADAFSPKSNARTVPTGSGMPRDVGAG